MMFWMRRPSGPQPIILKKNGSLAVVLPIQFVEVVTTVWYSHTYSFVML